ncbi:MAG: hypothetical protein JXD22_04005 [Sedimentisphaerales bacterium]|nr:hypothetical protein [Sedimentisphaerales bacterium]
MQKATNWDLIVQGSISLLWCQWSKKPENKDRSMGEVLEEFKEKYSNVEPLNIGTLLMASYILFVYPQQAEFDKADFSHIDTDKFIVHYGTQNTEKKRFCSRIRNGLTHGRFTVNGDQIELCDKKADGTDQFRSTIYVGDFGNFINGFMHEIKNQHFGRQNC